MNRTGSAAARARSFLRARQYGLLATLSRRFAGYPYGSVVPYVLDHAAEPVILISSLAEHTRNLRSDSRTSLLAHDPAADVQAGARLTLVGDAVSLEEDSRLRRRFLRYLPNAEQLLSLGDFAFWRIRPRTLRFIAGFGDARWIAAADYAPPENTLARDEDEILAHLNRHQREALRDCCLHFHGRSATDVLAIGVDCDGFDLRAQGERLRFEFAAPASNAAQVHERLAALTREARRA
ncbi:MAG: pyridoxamine 5'-phosphate oxidase family protein [Betaproteobacteria bacterium]|nr:pyridoxamine 5'-phosphate oxidase family protein [Betaproteobacteria bacterium]